MHDSAAGVDLAVLARHAAEGHEKLAVLGEHHPSSCGSPVALRTAPRYEASARAPRRRCSHPCERTKSPDRIEEAPVSDFGRGENVRHSPSHRSRRRSPCCRIRVLRERARQPPDRALRPTTLSTNGSAPRRSGKAPGPCSSQLLRTAGRRTRRRADFVGQHVQPDRRGIGILREGMQMDGLAGLVVFDFVDAPMGQRQRSLMLIKPSASRAIEE